MRKGFELVKTEASLFSNILFIYAILLLFIAVVFAAEKEDIYERRVSYVIKECWRKKWAYFICEEGKKGFFDILPYGSDSDAQKLDVYLPEGKGKFCSNY